MKPIREILREERPETTTIWLHREGTFYRAYQYSACLFARHIKGYKVHHRFYKNVQQEVFYLGFPAHHWQKLLMETEAKLPTNVTIECYGHQDEDQRVILKGTPPLTLSDFLQWGETIKQQQLPIQHTVRNTPLFSEANTNITVAERREIENGKVAEVLNLIRTFNLDEATGLACSKFIAKLQEMTGKD